jgi:hypothetical protein
MKSCNSPNVVWCSRFTTRLPSRGSSPRRELGCYQVATVIEQVASSKQLPANQRGTDNAENYDPN